MNKNILTIILISAMFVFSGCSLTGTNGANENGFSIGSGSSSKSGMGVDVSFQENNPPSEMYKGEETTFAFLITNYQEHEITDFHIKARGFDTNYVPALESLSFSGTLPKYSQSTGATPYPGFIVTGVVADGFEGNYNFNPEFLYAYTAKTKYTENLCVPDKTNKCNTKIDNTKHSNGPVTVSVSKVVAIGNDIKVQLDFTNSAGGKIVSDYFKTNDFSVEYSAPVVKLGSQTGTCKHIGTEKFQFINGKSSVYCEFPELAKDDSYASQLIVDFEYIYQQTVKKNIVVKDITQGLN